MSDEERIARLTALARRVWDNEEEANPVVSLGLRGCDPHAAYVVNDTGVVLTIAAPNDRALDALEAALLVLVGEPPAWIEKLANEWERKAIEVAERCRAKLPADNVYLGPLLEMTIGLVRSCADELRERARKP